MLLQILTLLGSLAMFLYGMSLMSGGGMARIRELYGKDGRLHYKCVPERLRRQNGLVFAR